MGHQLLELGIFFFQHFEFPHGVHIRPAVLLLPAVIRRRADAQPFADLLIFLPPASSVAA